VSAAGYLPEEADLGVGAAPGDAVVQVYAGPRPVVELTVPTGYRGVVTVAARVRDDAPFPPGQRAFNFTVPESGVVSFDAPPVFGHGAGPEFTARFADGSSLSKQPRDDEVGFRWLGRSGDTHTFVVGTRADYEDAEKSARGNGPGSRSSGSKSDGGAQQGRGRGRRGGGGR
jgi:hypothetical protein